jgi:hypothetical protein
LSPCKETANSHSIGIVLLIVISILLAALVLLMFQMPDMRWEDVPTVFEITRVRDVNDYGKMTEDSYVVLVNSGSVRYNNWNLYALTYINGVRIPAEIPTLNAYEQTNDHNHHGVQNLFGPGASGSKRDHDGVWNPNGLLAINYNDHTIHPGDSITIEIYDKTTSQIISRDTWPHTGGNTKKWMNLLFSHRGA